MNNKILFLIFVPFFIFSKVYIRNVLSGGRFEDNLLSYMHAKYLAYTLKLPFVCTDFIYSDHLLISEKEKKNNDIRSIKMNLSNFDSIFASLKSGAFNKSKERYYY